MSDTKTKLWEADFKRLVLRSGADGKFASARGPNDRKLDERDEAAIASMLDRVIEGGAPTGAAGSPDAWRG